MLMTSWKHWAVGSVAALTIMAGTMWTTDSVSAASPDPAAVGATDVQTVRYGRGQMDHGFGRYGDKAEMGQTFLAEALGDLLPSRFQGLVGYSHGVCPHVSYESHGTPVTQGDTFVKLLGYHHGFLGSKSQFSGCFLLQGTGDEWRGRGFFALLHIQVADDMCLLLEYGPDPGCGGFVSNAAVFQGGCPVVHRDNPGL